MELADTTGFLDSLLGLLGELFGADDAWGLGEGTVSENLVETLK